MSPESLVEQIESLGSTAVEEIGRGDRASALEELRIRYTGRKGELSRLQELFREVPPERKAEVGQAFNRVKQKIMTALEERMARCREMEAADRLASESIDVTLPGRRPRSGSLHPLSIVQDRIVEVFTRMGYRVAEGPEIEDDWHNFEALNIPPDHPARTMKDSLYVDVEGLLLRTETSAVQIRTMESQEPPVYVIVPGRVYRREAVDATHLSVFHQVEGLAVAEGISFADLKGTLEAFSREMFGSDVRVRISPDYFPFVEPGCQAAVSCFVCGGVGCRVCGNGWIELLGAGMVHPKVLENCGYDAERFTGFAFGVGIERVAMPLFGLLGYRARDARFSPGRVNAVLEGRFGAMVALVLLPWAARPSMAWREAVAAARSAGCRWAFVLAPPHLSIVDARGHACRRALDVSLTPALDPRSFPVFRLLAAAPAFDEAIITLTIDLGDIARARADMPLLSDLRTALPHLRRTLDEVERREAAVPVYDAAEPEQRMRGAMPDSEYREAAGNGRGQGGGNGAGIIPAVHVPPLAHGQPPSLDIDPVMVEDGLHMATTFHPELTGDPAIHEYFLRKVRAAA